MCVYIYICIQYVQYVHIYIYNMCIYIFVCVLVCIQNCNYIYIHSDIKRYKAYDSEF